MTSLGPQDLDALAREALDRATEGYQIIDADFRYLYLNNASIKQARKPRESLLGKTMMEAYPGIEDTPLFAVLRKSMTQRVVQRLDNEFTYPDGASAWFALRVEPVAQGVLICSTDISERARIERESSRARRVLRVFGEINQALAGAVDEQSLMRDVCRILVEHGRFRMAWVGLKQHDALRSIRVAASAGDDDGYSAALRLRWDDASHDEEPTGRAIRGGRVEHVRFIPSESGSEAWHKRARDRGFASSISLPFLVDGEVAGALGIYSSEPDGFDEQEARLLGEVVANLGHGLQSLRNRSLAKLHAEHLARLDLRMRRLAEAAKALLGVRDLSSIIDLVRVATRELLAADGASFMLRDGDACLYADEHVGQAPPSTQFKAQRRPIERCIGGWIMRSGDDLVVDDLAVDPRIGADMHGPPDARGLAMVPVRREDPVAAIGAYWHTPHHASAEDMAVLETLSHSVAIALDTLRVQGALTESETRYRTLIESLEDLVFTVGSDGRVLYASPSISKYGFDASEIVGQHFARFVHPDDAAAVQAQLEQTFAGTKAPSVYRVRDKLGLDHTVRSSSRAVEQFDGTRAIVGVMVDITELKRAEEALRAAQRMEAVGHLAGGVAHDFNNLLSVILSYSEFVADAVSGQAREDVEEIARAATRATGLTRQLLAFSRKQVLEPRVLELNRVAGDLEKMLRRLIGEDVQLAMRFAPDLGRIKADPGQIEQVIMNLAVNARDAMPHGGTLGIETGNVEFDSPYETPQGTVRPGSYVMLTVSDTGTGMDDITKQRLFEPFFTTKEVGKGTGLGLSTVYGIVQQSGGSICFESELAIGTVFRVYLPRVNEAAKALSFGDETRQSRGHETILLVEDESSVRDIAARILRGAGYKVLTAKDGHEALIIFDSGSDTIDLLITDVIMPHMSGRQLAERLLKTRPDLKVVFMSGYTDNIIARHGVLEPGMRLISKPFSRVELETKVRAAFDPSGEAELGHDLTPRDDV